MKILVVLLACLTAIAQEYTLGPDSQRQSGTPQGKVTQHTWTSKIFPGTVRDYWVYVPAQYNVSKPACLMIFQDGGGMVGENSTWRAPIVLDNLIHKREMPVTIGIFINPGVLPGAYGSATGPVQPKLRIRRSGRSLCAVSARRDSAGSGQAI